MATKKFIKSKAKYLLLIILLGSVIYGGQKILDEDETTTTQQTSVATVEKSTITKMVEASDQVETANFLSITTSVNGIVKQVFVNEGDTVAKGQKIMEVTLNSDGEESLAAALASYLQAKNAVTKAENTLLSKESALISAEEAFDAEKEENSYQSHDERISYKISENAYLTAKADYDIQLKEIDSARINLNKSWLSYQSQSPIIVAPDSGTIANIVTVEGMDISNSLSEKTSSSVASIKKEGTPIVSISVNELDINSISVGQPVKITLASVDDQVFMGKIVGIDKIGTIDSGITSYNVIAKFDEATDKALPNMGVDVEIIIEEKTDALIVPMAAIMSRQGKSYVTKMENGVEVSAEVTLGINDGKNTEIIEGLNEGDKVAVAALATSGFTDAQNQQNTMRMPAGGIGGFR